jgi:serine protease Do
MKRVVLAVIAVAAVLVVAGVALAPLARAQGRGQTIIATPFLEGPGSFIGVSVRDVTADEAAKARLQPAGGVLVEEVTSGTPAAQAGLQKGDIIVDFDGERVRSARQFTRLVQDTPSGRPVRATLLREGSRRTVDLTPQQREGSRLLSLNRDRLERQLRSLPDFSLRFDTPSRAFDLLAGAPARLGLTLQRLDGQLAAYFGVKEGVLVSSVERDSPAGQAGAQAGDVITAVNGRRVTSPSDVTTAVRSAQAGGSVTLEITRDRKSMTLTVKLPPRRDPPSPAPQGLPI